MDLVIAHGYGAPTMEMVVARAEVTQAEFHRYFIDLEDCCLQIYIDNLINLDRTVYETFERPGTWRERLRATIYASVRLLRDNPRKVRFDVIEMSSAGALPQIYRERQLERLVDIIDMGRGELDDPDSLTRSTAEGVIGSIYLLALEAVQDESGSVGDPVSVVPDIMYVALRPYLGHEVAMEEFSIPPPPEGPSGKPVNRYRPPVSKRGPSGEDSAHGLSRLPPGRHGLPREFVTENQRGRLTAGIIAVVADHGYNEATISQIAAAAGVSRRTFYTYFSSKEECFLDAYDQIAAHLREAAATAAAPYDEWPDRVAARLRSALEVFATNPDLVRFHLVEAPRAGGEIAARYRRGTDLALADLIAGIPPTTHRPSEAVEYVVMGGMAALISDRVQAGEGEALPSLFADLLELVLTPYLGREEAVQVAHRASA